MSVLSHEGGPFPVLYRSFLVPSGTAYRQGFIAHPDQVGRFPVVVLVAPSTGIKPYIKGLAWQLGRRGFAVTAVHAFGQEGDRSSSRDVTSAVDDAIDFVLTEETARPGRVGLWGFEDGGDYAAGAAMSRQEAGALVVSETPLPSDGAPDWVARVAVPMLGFYGAEDERTPLAAVDAAQGMSPNGQWIVYEGVGRGFLDEDGESYHPGAAYDALARASQLYAAALPPGELAA